MKAFFPEPRSEPELLERADALAGRTLAEVAALCELPVPEDLMRHKGWIGDLLEAAVGASGAGRPGPDLPDLGIEVKSVPVDDSGRPRESTWVCKAPIERLSLGPWRQSAVRAKLARVLWLPVMGSGPPGSRRVGAPLLWSPSAAQEELLAEDWKVLSELIAEGEVWLWTAKAGEALQLRPKAARGDNRVWALDASGDWVQTVPLGFYLRRSFTTGVLAAEARLTRP